MQDYNKTDRQLHWLCQVITKANRTWVPPREDDGHTNLYFDPLTNRITGRWIQSPRGEIILGLNLRDFQYEWLNKQNQVLQSIPIFEQTVNDLEKKVAKTPVSFGMDTDEFFQPLHFDIPDYGIVNISPDDLIADEVNVWQYYRRLANIACLEMTGFFQIDSEIRIWPHHFDTGIYVRITPGLGIGFGLAMQDEMAGDAYFYLSGYTEQHPIKYDQLPRLENGRWETGDGWQGAVLPLKAIPANAFNAALQTVTNFSVTAGKWYLQREN